ncbi:signal recognition particle protein [Mesomycoplasma hyorhinis]|uniref:signal recognition particle protein n=1 Tax=Mesomycoplasma hyorhinis TaxID=2100 RepID=UPI00037FFB22|nr:signal recognition particle protein [Mesomycoplasma hyorhinis]QPC29385.1 signal recognition particle protein [Mesomycoplasma hyorhinis]UVT32028.1 signal recognition particle protein [Mesomycoplasma hyorhinis]UVT32704.1 signal recognition particle protein [Mesomycoplasma hyorhinis]UVT33383.1 signal recognition particle protein [Mesomycoplasma hyorhinis]SYV91705.1 Signal recognition particle GTPase [Mesomycoplasma hyorhinis]
MLDFLSKRFQKSFAKMNAKTTLKEEDLNEVIREIKLALLEADVNLLIVKDFIKEIKEKALATEITSTLNPQQQFIKIVNENLVQVLGEKPKQIKYNRPIEKIVLVGLQGSGKTTTVAKLAHFSLRKKHIHKPLLIAADIYRPAAIEQLIQLGKQINIPVFSQKDSTPQEIVSAGLDYASSNDFDLVIIDTAGRLSIDEKLMQELKDIEKIAKPHEIFFVADALSGQDIINVAKTFNENITLSGSIITKLDSDARGGAALSLIKLLKIPIVFIGTGEKITNFDLFYPDRMASRILGMGDVLSLIEKAEEVIDKDQIGKIGKKIFSGNFNLDDLLNSLYQIQKLGKITKIIKLIPGMADKINAEQITEAEKKIKLYEILISSMTLEERKKPKLLKNDSRKRRILKGSGRSSQEFNRLLSEFEQMSKKMKEMSQNKGGIFNSMMQNKF